MKKALSVFALILILSFAIVLDRLYDINVPKALEPHGMLRLSLIKLAGTVLITALLIGLAWYVLYVADRSLWVALVYVIAGSLISVFTTLTGYYALSSILINHTLSQWYVSIVASRLALTQHVGVFIMLIGVMRLLPDRFLWNKQES